MSSAGVSSTGFTRRSNGSPDAKPRRASARCSRAQRSPAATRSSPSSVRSQEIEMAEILTMPEVAAGATEAIVSTWLVEPGQVFATGDAIVTVETEKAIVDVEAESDGVLL